MDFGDEELSSSAASTPVGGSPGLVAAELSATNPREGADDLSSCGTPEAATGLPASVRTAKFLSISNVTASVLSNVTGEASDFEVPHVPDDTLGSTWEEEEEEAPLQT